MSTFDADYTRQQDWYDRSKSPHHVTVVGCGGIGSFTSMLVKMLGVTSMTVIDFDHVEPHNVPNQLFPRAAIGKSKANFVANFFSAFGADSQITAVHGHVQDHADKLYGTVVTGLDSMKARADVWEFVRNNPRVDYLIDGRLNGLNMVIWIVNVHDAQQAVDYQNEALYSDEEAEEQPCTARAVIDVAGFMASFITSQVRLIASGQVPERAIAFDVESFDLWLPFRKTEDPAENLDEQTISDWTTAERHEVDIEDM